MANPIVVLEVSQSVPPTPSNLQQTGALISQGGTTLAAQAFSLLTSTASLSSILTQPAANASLSWSSGTVTVTTTAALPTGYTTGLSFSVTIAGATPAGYNGTFAATVTGADTFTYPLASSPGTETAPGTWVPANAAELTNAAASFFGQGNVQTVYVLELGPGGPTTGVPALTTFITNTPNFFYGYRWPNSWDANSAFLSFLANYEALTAKVYFVGNTTTGNYPSYPTTMKDVMKCVPSPNATTDDLAAAVLYNLLVNRPGPGNRMPPMEYRFVYGITPWPTAGNATVIAGMIAGNCNFVLTGAEGGISNAVLYGGCMADGNDALYWYSVDWIQINLNLNLSNTIINGSNTTINPLYISQDGINRLQNADIQTLNDAVQFGLATGQVARSQTDSVTFATAIDNGNYDGMIVCNAVPFQTYYTENPGDYKTRAYNGLQNLYIPSAGFDSIQVQLVISQFAATAGIGF